MNTSAIVTAAGCGVRFGGLSRRINKCVHRVNGKPLLCDIIDKLKIAGADPIYVVTGHLGNEVEATIGETATPIRNPRFKTTGIVASLYAARDRLYGHRFLFTTGDHFFFQTVLEKCLQPTDGIRIMIQKKPAYDAEDAKVIFNEKGISLFGKDIPVSEAKGEFAGMALFSPMGSRLFFDLAWHRLRIGDTRLYVMDIFNQMVKEGLLRFDISFCGPEERSEIDTVADLRRVRKMADGGGPGTLIDAP